MRTNVMERIKKKTENGDKRKKRKLNKTMKKKEKTKDAETREN